MIPIPTRLCRAVDSAVLWRLGMISVAPHTGVQDDPLDPEAFWRASRVSHPAPVTARLVTHPPRWARLLPRAVRPTFIDLVGPSRGPGDHWGASNFKARIALSPRPDAPFVLLLHGYAVPAPWYEERQMQVLTRRGISAGRLEMPFHLSRRLPRHPVGAGYFSSDTARTLAVLSQTTEDAAAVVAWARDELGARIGVHGVSLGGLIGGLLGANMDLDSAILITPPCDLVQIIMDLAPMKLRRELDILDGRGGPWGEDAATARATLARELAPVTLRRLRPVMRPDRIVVVLAHHDRIVGANAVREMADAWGAETWPYSAGHVTLLAARGLGPRIHDRLERDLLGSPEPAAAVAG